MFVEEGGGGGDSAGKIVVSLRTRLLSALCYGLRDWLITCPAEIKMLLIPWTAHSTGHPPHNEANNQDERWNEALNPSWFTFDTRWTNGDLASVQCLVYAGLSSHVSAVNVVNYRVDYWRNLNQIFFAKSAFRDYISLHASLLRHRSYRTIHRPKIRCNKNLVRL